ncbi:hypothetical protein [Reyranella sp.]|uniref:hypothetical protein n=1 Tax=Reyranella sp. TaxID=1929291 RepID=UPI0027309266|nr:hypothetical protein [Reyranella sp.]MDP2377908.1 hypothetical protein [Reyranella sp.]
MTRNSPSAGPRRSISASSGCRTTPPVWRNGQEVGSVRQFDNRLLQFLLKAHRPDLYGDCGKAAAPSLPFDLVKRMADAEARLAEQEKKADAGKKAAAKGKAATHAK